MTRAGKKAGLIVLFLTLTVIACPAAWAQMPVTFLNIEPVAGAFYGWGYNLTTQQFTAPCVNANSSATYSSGDSQQHSFFDLTENTATIAAQSNISASMALKVLAGGGTFAANSKASIATGSESSTYRQTLFAGASRYKMPNFLDLGQVSFRPQALQLLVSPGGKGQFSQQCGDAFVIGMQYGREFIGTASIVRQDLKSWTKYANETGMSYEDPTSKVSVDVNIGKSMEQAFGVQNIVVKTYSTGSNISSPTKAGELSDYYQTFLNSAGDDKVVKLIVAPYNLVEQFPWENPLKEITKEDYIGMMVVALWGLKAAINDADFVFAPQTAAMFALGSNNISKEQRINYIRQQRDSWQREYDMLLSSAQNCDRQFTDECRRLAEFYDRHRNLAAQRHAVLPDRYLSDCSQPFVLKDFTGLQTALSGQTFGTPFKGDSEASGNPVRVISQLKFLRDQRQLKADLSVAKIEWKRSEWKKMPVEVRSDKGESGWALKAHAVVFDLDQPARFGFGQENLKHCSFAGTGAELPAIQSPQAETAAQRFGFGQGIVQGYIDGITGKHPRGQQYFGNGEGALDYITCELDRKGKDNQMQCTGLGIRNVRLTLVSQQDLAADAWKSPGPILMPTALVNFSQGKPVALDQNSRQYAVFTQLLPAARQKHIAKAEAQKSASSQKFQSPRFSLPAAQFAIMQKRLELNQLKLKNQMNIQGIRQ